MLNNILIKPLIIFKGKTNRCINNIPENDAYNLSFQKNSWCDEDQFIKFISYLPNDKKILLICDNFGSHKTQKVKDFMSKEYPLIDILLLPPNTTSILQPLDISINKPFKTYIKNQYMDWLIKYYDNNKILPKLIKNDRNKLLIIPIPIKITHFCELILFISGIYIYIYIL